MRLSILCPDCALPLMDEDSEVTLAWMPEFDPAEDNILVCPYYEGRNKAIMGSITKCDSCGDDITVASSSKWLTDKCGRELNWAGLN